MVYLHAGEFRFGAANDAENNFPYNFGGKVILVTANVRLGLFGFAALEQLRVCVPFAPRGTRFSCSVGWITRSSVCQCERRSACRSILSIAVRSIACSSQQTRWSRAIS
jgi:hypothetical protein